MSTGAWGIHHRAHHLRALSGGAVHSARVLRQPSEVAVHRHDTSCAPQPHSQGQEVGEVAVEVSCAKLARAHCQCRRRGRSFRRNQTGHNRNVRESHFTRSGYERLVCFTSPLQWPFVRHVQSSCQSRDLNGWCKCLSRNDRGWSFAPSAQTLGPSRNDRGGSCTYISRQTLGSSTK